MIPNFLKIKNKNLLISLFSVLFLSSCSNADISDIENRAFKCTKYVSSEKKLPEHIKNPITFLFSNEKLNYSKSIPFSEVFIKKGEKNFKYDSSSSVSYGLNYWGDLEITLEDDERVNFPIQYQGKEINRGGSGRFRELEYQIFKASTKKDSYNGKWTLSEDLVDAAFGGDFISLKGTLKCALIGNS